MSRVEDDRNDARIAQQLAIKKQQEEAKKTDRATTDSAFARKLAGTPQGATTKAPLSGYESLIDSMPESAKAQTKESLGRSVLKQATSAFQEKLQQSKTGENEKLNEGRLSGAEADNASASGRTADAKGSEETAENKKADQKKDDELAAKGKGGRDGTLKTGADGGGGKGAGGGDSNPGDGGMAPGFRFNPALMAPVPVAQASNSATNERLRRVAQEIAQKIVENVRIGTNAAGKAEFQIDLRSNVLSGLSIKLSGGNGKISASFSGSDREVLKMLEENKEGLAKALSSRGLTLESLKIEVRA